MNVIKIAYRSLQFRALGTLLTVLSMALGVMMVVSVLTIYGLVNESFRSKSSFGFDLLVGARGGGTQLTMNSVYYLSKPIETIPYEYYLAFQEQGVREPELKNSLAFRALELEHQSLVTGPPTMPGMSGWSSLLNAITENTRTRQQGDSMRLEKDGLYSIYVDYAIPILLGDYYQLPGKELSFRVCATNQDFFDKLVLDAKANKRFAFSSGRRFENKDADVGFFGAVIGSVVARKSGLNVGDRIQVTHGVPGESSSHLHEQLFEVTGILEPSGTPHDRVVFVNMEGFYLINDHVKNVEDDSLINPDAEPMDADPVEDIFRDEGDDIFAEDAPDESGKPSRDGDMAPIVDSSDSRNPLPIEQREITSILIHTQQDEFGMTAYALQPILDAGDLEKTLNWSSFRPVSAQTASQCVFPVAEVERLFKMFVEPARLILLALTILICVVSGLSILVGIYNSMSQRHHEIAVMRALGARRSHVVTIMLAEAILLGLAGGGIGWVAGHFLNMLLGPTVESFTGIPVHFWDIAPREKVFAMISPWFGNSWLANFFADFAVSPELLLIPGLVLLAALVGVYPAISAYRTDVSRSLGK